MCKCHSGLDLWPSKSNELVLECLNESCSGDIPWTSGQTTQKQCLHYWCHWCWGIKMIWFDLQHFPLIVSSHLSDLLTACIISYVWPVCIFVSYKDHNILHQIKRQTVVTQTFQGINIASCIIFTEWRYQEFEQPEARLIVAGLEGVYEKEEEKAVESQRVSLHRDQDAVTEETGQQADTPQHP